MTARLTASLWVQAYMRRLQLANIPAYVTAKGDATAGAVIVKLATMDGRAQAFARRMTLEGREWMTLAEGPEPEVDAALEKQRRFDPDLWILEIEDRHGRTLLDEPGLE
ncbi:MAG: DUF1491 family protein [Pseudomonadota bacterium]